MNLIQGEQRTAGSGVLAQSNPEMEDDDVSLLALLQTFRRYKGLIFFTTILSLIFAGIYVFTAKPRFTAQTQVLIDPRKSEILPEQTADPLVRSEGLTVDSEIELVKSAVLLKRVAVAQNIFEDPEFTTPSLRGLVKSWIYKQLQLARKKSEEDAKRSIFNSFRKRVSAERVLMTYVIKINYTSTDQERASEVANAIAQAYLDDKLETRFNDAKRTNEWLGKRIEKLKLQVIEADRAVELYRAKHGIADASAGLVSEQQQSELNSKLILARAETAQNKARFDRLKVAIKRQGADAAVAGSLRSSVITKLRNEYSNATQRADELRSRYGSGHLAYRNARSEVARLRSLIVEEMNRFLNSYKSDYEVSLAREKSLEKGLKGLKGASVFSGQKQVRLRELKRQAGSVRGLYKTLLDNFRKSNERETLPTVRARIIEEAQKPLIASWPKKKRVLLIALFFGLGSGMGLAFLRDMMDRKVWSQGDLEELFPGRFLGMIPLLPLAKLKRGSLTKTRKATVGNGKVNTGILAPEVIEPRRALLADQSGALPEALRNILLSFRLASNKLQIEGAQTASFVSSMPGEGKSTISLLQALYLAGSGNRTLLIDSDFRSPALTNALAPAARHGLADIPVNNLTDLKDIICRDETSGLHFLPASGAQSLAGAAEIMLMNGDISKLIEALRPHYDYIVIDVPPILFLPDARVMAEAIDHVVVVAEWGKVEKQAIEQAVKNSPELAQKIIGAIFNKVDRAKIRRYSGSHGYYGHKGYDYGYGYGYGRAD